MTGFPDKSSYTSTSSNLTRDTTSTNASGRSGGGSEVNQTPLIPQTRNTNIGTVSNTVGGSASRTSEVANDVGVRTILKELKEIRSTLKADLKSNVSLGGKSAVRDEQDKSIQGLKNKIASFNPVSKAFVEKSLKKTLSLQDLRNAKVMVDNFELGEIEKPGTSGLIKNLDKLGSQLDSQVDSQVDSPVNFDQKAEKNFDQKAEKSVRLDQQDLSSALNHLAKMKEQLKKMDNMGMDKYGGSEIRQNLEGQIARLESKINEKIGPFLEKCSVAVSWGKNVTKLIVGNFLTELQKSLQKADVKTGLQNTITLIQSEVDKSKEKYDMEPKYETGLKERDWGDSKTIKVSISKFDADIKELNDAVGELEKKPDEAKLKELLDKWESGRNDLYQLQKIKNEDNKTLIDGFSANMDEFLNRLIDVDKNLPKE